MRGLRAQGGVLLAMLALVTAPLATACYAPRIESCRGALEDFSTLGAIEIVDVGFEWPDDTLAYRVRAADTSAAVGSRCVAVHSELWQDGVLASTIDTPVEARLAGGVLTTSRVLHYRAPFRGMTLRTTALGQTIEVALDERLFPVADAGAGGPDAGP